MAKAVAKGTSGNRKSPPKTLQWLDEREWGYKKRRARDGVDKELVEWLRLTPEERSALDLVGAAAKVAKWDKARLLHFVRFAQVNKAWSYGDMNRATGIDRGTLSRLAQSIPDSRARQAKAVAREEVIRTNPRYAKAVDAAVEEERLRRQQELVETPLPSGQVRKWAIEILKGASEDQAAIRAGIPKEDAPLWSQRQLEDGNTRDFLIQCFARMGITHNSLAAVHSELLQANKVDAKTGRLVPDNTNRLRALELAYKVMADVENDDDQSNAIVLQFGENAQRWMEAFVTGRKGRKPDIIEADSEAVESDA